jgi:hypothetical protein
LSSTPLLLIVWRRPDCTAQLLDALRPLQPQRLYLACDGPRPGVAGEDVQVDAVRQLLQHAIDWPCQVKRRFSPVNQGCRVGVTAAISWFFEHEEAGIILEDDCLPHPDFFPFCAELLDCFREDARVFSILGSNVQQGLQRGDGSYYFSLHTNPWGWASWRRAWQCCPVAGDLWPLFRSSAAFSALFPDPIEAKFWRDSLDSLLGIDGAQPFADTWDFQWMLACWLMRGLAAVPNVNLISNIGFQGAGSHCSGGAWFENQPVAALPMPLRHPSLVLPDPDADRTYFLTRCNGHALHIEARRRRWGALYPALELAAGWRRRLQRLSARALLPGRLSSS